MKASAFAFAALLVATALPGQTGRPLAELQTAARGGSAEAQFQLGEAYRTGASGVAVDRDQAIIWLKRAADQGHVPARDALGMLLFTKGNRQEAMPLIEAAAARGDARALYILATARFNGDYVARDWPRAYAEMSRAADLGLPQAKTSLAQMDRYLLPADKAKAEGLRATMAAVAPPPGATPLPRATTPSLPAPVAPPARTAAPAPPLRAESEPVAPPPPPPPPQVRPAPTPIRTVDVPPSRPAAAEPITLGNRVRTTMPAPPTPRPAQTAAVAPPPPRPKPVALTETSPKPKPAAAVTETSAAKGRWKVQLGAYSSRDRADAQWKTLTGKVKSLGGYGKLVTPTGALFRLQAEGFAARDQAEAMCARITSGGGACLALQP